ncbi:unnamed protein product [Linum trigynum]|uniref:Peptidase S49 domain-containing protein n=1 Tax=Linum trigynum TaxID=586398 RepID=A0AAV2G0S1_9ROSI
MAQLQIKINLNPPPTNRLVNNNHYSTTPMLLCRRRRTSAPALLLHLPRPAAATPPSPHHLFSPPVKPYRKRRVDSAVRDPPEVAEESSENGSAAVRFRKAAAAAAGEEYPADGGAFGVRKELGRWDGFLLKLRMLIAPPWQRVAHGSVLCMHLRGEISDTAKGRFLGAELALPQVCENFAKAANDPRIAGIYLKIDGLECGWGKLDEIRRHILDFRKSGKFVVGYMSFLKEKEYYLGCACDELYAPSFAHFSLYGFALTSVFLRGVLEKMGIEPVYQRIGKYKKAGDQMMRKTIAEPHLEVLTLLLENIHENWVATVSSSTGKKREDIEEFLNEGAYRMERLKEEGFITDVFYEDQVMELLKKKVGLQEDKILPTVDYRKYSRVKNWTLGLNGGKDEIAVIRTSGLIVNSWSLLNFPGSGIIPADVIKQIRLVRDSKKYKAVVIRIDSAGGDALASDLIWREVRLLATKKPVIASMSDTAASGGYYIAMGSTAIVAEKLTLTSSVGVIQGRFNLAELHRRIGYHKHVVSKGKYSEFNIAGHRPLRPEESELHENITKHVYKEFRDKAAFSRSMSVEEMEKVAQGRIWHGADAVSCGLVDAIGGVSRAVAIAKRKANIPDDKPVKVVELSRPNSSLPEMIMALGTVMAGLGKTAQAISPAGLKFFDDDGGVEARMDFDFQSLDGASDPNLMLTLMKCFLGSI